MGFLNAVYELGKQGEEGELAAFLKLPLPSEKTGKSGELKKGGNEIRIHLSVKNVDEKPLNVLGVANIDIVDFMSGEKDVEKWKMKYLYRDPVGSNTSWKFTPILKIGKPPKDEDKKRIAFVDGTNKKKPFFKTIKEKILMDYENSGYFTPGSVDRIMEALESKIDHITELFSENESHLIVFGVEKDDDFLYPGEIPTFIDYFKEKMNSRTKKSGDEKRSVSTKVKRCAMCGREMSTFVNLDEVFNFATFDKKSFLPGLDKNSRLKIFPICTDCFKDLSHGRERLDREFLDGQTIPGIKIWCIPEIIGSHSSETLEDVVSQFKKYVSKENTEVEDMFSSFAKFENENLLFHFVFWEQKKAQELVHSMVEDVPPTQLRMIERCWMESLKVIEAKEEMIQKNRKLGTAFKFIFKTITYFGKQNKAETKFLRDSAIKIISSMLNGEKLNVDSVKSTFVERIPNLLHGRNKDNKDMEIKNMFMIIDFISRFNSEVGK